MLWRLGKDATNIPHGVVRLASFSDHSKILSHSCGENLLCFLHSCNVKSGSGLGTRLLFCLVEKKEDWLSAAGSGVGDGHMHTHTHTCTRAHTHIHMHPHTHMHAHPHTRHAHMRICTHINAHTSGCYHRRVAPTVHSAS